MAEQLLRGSFGSKKLAILDPNEEEKHTDQKIAQTGYQKRNEIPDFSPTRKNLEDEPFVELEDPTMDQNQDQEEKKQGLLEGLEDDFASDLGDSLNLRKSLRKVTLAKMIDRQETGDIYREDFNLQTTITPLHEGPKLLK